MFVASVLMFPFSLLVWFLIIPDRFFSISPEFSQLCYLFKRSIIWHSRGTQIEILGWYPAICFNKPYTGFMVGAQYATGDQWRNNSRKNEEMEPKQKQHSAVDVTGDRSKVWCCKEQYCIGIWNIRSMNQGKYCIGTWNVRSMNQGPWIKMTKWMLTF